MIQPSPPPFPRARFRRHAGIGGTVAIAALLVMPAGALQAATGSELTLTGLDTPLSDGELASLRGGFLTEGGLEITFGFRLDLEIGDKLKLSSQFKPLAKPDKPARPGMQLWQGFENGELELTLTKKQHAADKDGGGEAGGGIKVAGDGEVEVLAGPTDGFGGGDGYSGSDHQAAKVVKTDDSVILTSKGDTPVKATIDKDGFEVVVGDPKTTSVVNRIGRDQVSARITNRRHGARIKQRLIVDVNLLNFSQFGKAQEIRRKAGRLSNQIGRGIIHSLLPR